MKWEYGTRHRRTRIVRRRLFLGIVAILVILSAGYAVMHFGPDDLKSALRKPFLKLQDPNGEGINPEGVTETGWQTEFLMDTFVSIRAVGDNADEAIEAALGEMRRIESLMSRYVPTSDVSLINRSAGGPPVKVASETFHVIEEAVQCARLTNGAFDITIGPLMDLWEFNSSGPTIPGPEEIEQAKPLVGWELIELDPENMTVRLPKEGMSIDLGGIAKGYAAQQGARVLREYGIRHALIDAGGNIVAVGSRAEGNPWRIGIRDPRGEGPEATIGPTIHLVDAAVATSGDYERFFIHDGKRYHHILNPETGMPVESVSSVTVVTESPLHADMLSTAVFVLGPDEGMRFVETLDGVSAMIVDANGNIVFSNGFPGANQ